MAMNTSTSGAGNSPVVGAGVLVSFLLGMNELLVLAAGGLVVLLANIGQRYWSEGTVGILALPLAASAVVTVPSAMVSLSLATLFLKFLKIGAVLYGSAYVLLALVRADFVERLGWLTDQQLIDAIAVGQFTPGPVFTTATFIGYLVGGGTRRTDCHYRDFSTVVHFCRLASV